MDKILFEQLWKEGKISAGSYEKITSRLKLVSVHWDIKTVLYLGLLLLTSGLGILIYKNIDSIGHQAILGFIAAVCAASFIYCFKTSLPYSRLKTVSPNSIFDYILLLACSSFIILVGYLQYQYNLFGHRYGLATFLPMILLFFSAYYFDHAGILSMAIISFAAWVGVTVTPLEILEANDFDSPVVIFTFLAVAIFLIGLSYLGVALNIKKHFETVYANFGMHLLFISCLAAMFRFEDSYLFWFVLLAAGGYFFYRRSLKARSFNFVVVAALYVYIGAGFVLLHLLEYLGNFNMGTLTLAFMYFILSATALVLFLIRVNKKFKT